jgi:hypothetical protein
MGYLRGNAFTRGNLGSAYFFSSRGSTRLCTRKPTPTSKHEHGATGKLEHNQEEETQEGCKCITVGGMLPQLHRGGSTATARLGSWPAGVCISNRGTSVNWNYIVKVMVL